MCSAALQSINEDFIRKLMFYVIITHVISIYQIVFLEKYTIKMPLSI